MCMGIARQSPVLASHSKCSEPGYSNMSYQDIIRSCKYALHQQKRRSSCSPD